METPVLGLMLIRALATLIGVLLVASAVRAVWTGRFPTPRGMMLGVSAGVTHIEKNSRALPFWFCVIFYIAFGCTTLAATWLLL
jgi:hypothetical protein